MDSGANLDSGAKKKRHLQKYKTWFIVEAVIKAPTAGFLDKPPQKRRAKRRPIRNLAEAMKITAKALYKRAHNAETKEEQLQYIEWARERTRWEFKVGIRKLQPKKSERSAA